MCGKKGKTCVSASAAYWLMVVGGLNWGLIGVGYFFSMNWNVVYLIFGSVSWLEALVYVLVGVGTVGTLVGCKCKICRINDSCDCGGGACACSNDHGHDHDHDHDHAEESK